MNRLRLCNILPALAGVLGLLSVGCSNVPLPEELERGKANVRAMGEPRSLDPSFSYNEGDAPVIALMFPAYYHYEYLKQKTYQLSLDIGTSEPTLEKLTPAAKGEAAERWTYRIRKDLKFQDDPCFKETSGKGRGVTAADVVYSFKRMADPAVNCPVASYFADKIVGWEEFSKGFETNKAANYDKPFKGVYVDPKDPYAFVIELTQPYPQLKYLMAMAFTSPQSREAVEFYKEEYALHHPVGFGAFKLKEYVAHDHVWLTRNENAHPQFYPTEADPELQPLLADAGKPVPFVDDIYLKVVTESVTSYNLFQQGYLDSLTVSFGNANIVPAANGMTQEMKDRGIQLTKNNRASIDYLAFNMDDPVFGGYTEDKKKLRQAISLAVDSNQYIDLSLQGMGMPAQWIVPPGLEGFDPNFKNPYRQFDPKLVKAKQLLAEAGYPDGVDKKTGKRLELNYDYYATSPALAQTMRLFQKQIQRLGVQVNLVINQYSTFNSRIEKKQVQFFQFGWNADYPDAENFAFMLYGPNESPGPNASLYNNPEYNKLFLQMRDMNDSPERNAIMAKMREISTEDCPWIYLTYPVTRSLIQPWVANQRANPLAADSMKYVRVDPEKRVELQSSCNKAIYWPILAGIACIVGLVIPATATIRNRTNRRVRREENAAR
jgi:oligopeptide transport system substrate-binding protein